MLNYLRGFTSETMGIDEGKRDPVVEIRAYLPKRRHELSKTVETRHFEARNFAQQNFERDCYDAIRKGGRTVLGIVDPERGDPRGGWLKVHRPIMHQGFNATIYASKVVAGILDYRGHVQVSAGATSKQTHLMQVGLTQTTSTSLKKSVSFDSGMDHVTVHAGLEVTCEKSTAWNNTTTVAKELVVSKNSGDVTIEIYQDTLIHAHVVIRLDWIVNCRDWKTDVWLKAMNMNTPGMIINYRLKSGKIMAYPVFLTQNQFGLSISYARKETAPTVPARTDLYSWLLEGCTAPFSTTTNVKCNLHYV